MSVLEDGERRVGRLWKVERNIKNKEETRDQKYPFGHERLML